MNVPTLSIKFRIALLFSIVSALLFGLISLYVYNTLERGISEQDDRALQARVERVKTMIRPADKAAIKEMDPQLYANMLDNKDSLLWVLDENKQTVLEVNPGALPIPNINEGLQPLINTAAPTPARLAWTTLEHKEGRYYIIAGKLLEERQKILSAYRLNLAASSLIGVLLAFILGWEVVRRGLKPLVKLSEHTSQIDTQHLNIRLNENKQPEELKALSRAFNLMLERLQYGYAQLSQFSEDLAHEMRTPLNNLMGQNQLALSQAQSSIDYDTLLSSQQEEYERLARMIDSMLFLARAEKQDAVLNIETVDLAPLAEQLHDYFEGLAQEKNMVIFSRMEGCVMADRSLLRRALANLMANAIRYGHPDSSIELASREEYHHTDILVINEGPPIPSILYEKIFDRFYRIDSSRSAPDDSGGLGLAIVKSIMSMHQGDVFVNSHNGQTIFTLRFYHQEPTLSSLKTT